MLGNLVLLLTSIKLSDGIQEEAVMAVEYADIFPEEFEEDIAMREVPAPEIQTHSAYNEAQEFIEAQENSRNPIDEPQLESEEAQQEFSDPNFDAQATAINEAKEKLKNLKKELSNHSLPAATSEGSNKKTTISYHLSKRKARMLPNPVYTCDRGGKIVIDIVVTSTGAIKKATYNEAASTTTNGCLIDGALSYARKARFTPSASQKDQKGTITYSFPGQY